MIFKIYESDFGIKINGVSYEFTHIESLTIEDPENTKLARGANATNKIGLVYKEGVRDPKRITVVIKDMGIELKDVLDAAYTAQTRMDVFAISRVDGSSKMAKNSVLCQQPQQLVLDESPDSMNVSLSFESFDLTETMKS